MAVRARRSISQPLSNNLVSCWRSRQIDTKRPSRTFAPELESAKQEDFCLSARTNIQVTAKTPELASDIKVFWFFSSEKNFFLPVTAR
jgi:hypothetical protein